MNPNIIPELTPVESSNIEAVGHGYSGLYVRFKNKAVYLYEDVPVEKYAMLLSSESKGCYLNKEIKGKFNYRKVA